MLVFNWLIMIPQFFSCHCFIKVFKTLYQKVSKNRLTLKLEFHFRNAYPALYQKKKENFNLHLESVVKYDASMVTFYTKYFL